jgi:DNA-binding NarL/FixJ family response regulator
MVRGPALPNRPIGIYTYQIEAILAEAEGYILKNAGKDELLKALHRITDGGNYFADDIVPIIYKQYHQQKIQDEQLKELTERKKEILSFIVKEYTSDDIAKQLLISKKTVDNHRQHLPEKTGCKNTVELVKLAVKLGIG